MSQTPHRSKRQRSPSYPGIGLEAALDRARSLYKEEGRNSAPNDAILDHWGYSPKSGPGFGVLAALRRFGLLENDGPGKSRLSDLALRIILDERDDSIEREEAIKQAALMPSIHQEIWRKYPNGLPSDATLRHFLRFDKGFTDAAADELIRQFRDTVAFANLAPGDSLSPDAKDSSLEDAPAAAVSTAVAPSRGGSIPGDQRAVPIPLSATEWVTLQGAFPLTEDAWEQLLRILNVMKPGLVAPPAEDTEDTD